MRQQPGFSPNVPLSSGPAIPINPRLSWLKIWIKALTQPSLATYEEIANNAPRRNFMTCWWIFVANTLSAAIATLFGLMFLPFFGVTQDPRSGTFATISHQNLDTILRNLVLTPVIGVFAVIMMAWLVLIFQLFITRMGGKGSYSRFLFTIAAFWTPLTLILTLVALIPVIGPSLENVVQLYEVVLLVVAVDVVNQFGLVKNILSRFGPKRASEKVRSARIWE